MPVNVMFTGIFALIFRVFVISETFEQNKGRNRRCNSDLLLWLYYGLYL